MTVQPTPNNAVPSSAGACCRCITMFGTTAPNLHKRVRGQLLYALWQDMKRCPSSRRHKLKPLSLSNNSALPGQSGCPWNMRPREHGAGWIGQDILY